MDKQERVRQKQVVDRVEYALNPKLDSGLFADDARACIDPLVPNRLETSDRPSNRKNFLQQFYIFTKWTRILSALFQILSQKGPAVATAITAMLILNRLLRFRQELGANIG